MDPTFDHIEGPLDRTRTNRTDRNPGDAAAAIESAFNRFSELVRIRIAARDSATGEGRDGATREVPAQTEPAPNTVLTVYIRAAQQVSPTEVHLDLVVPDHQGQYLECTWSGTVQSLPPSLHIGDWMNVEVVWSRAADGSPLVTPARWTLIQPPTASATRDGSPRNTGVPR